MLGTNLFKKKVRGCLFGKIIGGTLGMPYEGTEGPFQLCYYDPIPDKMIPNDDLDIQILYALVLNQMSDIKVNRFILSKAWKEHLRFPFDEYAVALRNLQEGIEPAEIEQAHNETEGPRPPGA